MQPARATTALYAAGATIALVDVVVSALAWARLAERPLVALAIACTLGAATAAAGLWGALVAGAAARLRVEVRAVLVLAPAIAVVGWGLARTHTAHAKLGAAAPAVMMAALALAAAVGARLPLLDRPLAQRAIAAAALAGVWLLPPRLYWPIKALLVVTAFVLLARQRSARPVRPATLALAAVGLAGSAGLLLQTSANLRFIIHRQTLATGLLLEGLAALRPEAEARAAATPDGPAVQLDRVYGDAHLVFITVDALRADARLPEIDARLPGAVRFERVYAQAPQTSFSVTSLLTSAYPDRVSTDPRPATAAERLRARGWFTQAWYPAGLFFDGRGKLLPYATARFGFAWTDTRTLDARDTTDAVLERVSALRATGEPRAFLWAHYFDAHEPYRPRAGVAASAGPRERYLGEVAHVDREVARLLDGLRRLARPVVVVITADHGEEFGEHGGAYHGSSLYEEQVRVPLRLGVIGGRPLGPRTIDGPVELVDVLPTALGLLGEDTSGLAGANLLDVARERDAHAQVHTLRMLVRGGHKLVHDKRRDVNELYDLAADPGETHNRFDAEPELGRTLLTALRRFYGLETPEALLATLASRGASADERIAAMRALGELAYAPAIAPLEDALTGTDPRITAEAALALARIGRASGRARLHALLDEPEYRRQAGLMLGHLRDPKGIEALREATHDERPNTRRHALLFLGLLGAPEALPTVLASARDDLPARNEAYLALGRITSRAPDPEAVRFLVDRLAVEEYDDARAHLAWGLGLGAGRADPRTVPLLVAQLRADPPLRYAGEALVRLGAIASGAIGGVDFAPGLVAPGLQDCRTRNGDEIFDGARTCVQTGPVRLVVHDPGGGVLLVRARAKEGRARETVRLGDVVTGTLELGPMFVEHRLEVPKARGPVALGLEADHPVELDHALLLPPP